MDRGDGAAAGDGASAGSEGASPSPGYEVVPVEQPGQLSGKVLLSDPKATAGDFSAANPEGVCVGALENDRLVTGINGGIAQGVVRLVDIKSGKGVPAHLKTRRVNQSDCKYRPHIAVSFIGSRVDFLNSDPTPHNVRIEDTSGTVLMNVAQPTQGQSDPFDVQKVGPHEIGCDYHPWMNAVLFGVDNPYVAVSERDGSWTIDDVPPGTYELELWINGFHPLPVRDQEDRLVRFRYSEPHRIVRTVVVPPNGTIEENFTITIKDPA